MKQYNCPITATILTAVLLIILASGCAQNARLTEDNVKLREEIEAVNRFFMETKKDSAAIATLYTEDAQMLPPNGEPVRGREAIEAFFAGGGGSANLRTIEVEGMGDTAYELGAYTFFNSAGQAVDEGKYIVIWKKEDGRWKLHRDMWSSNK